MAEQLTTSPSQSTKENSLNKPNSLRRLARLNLERQQLKSIEAQKPKTLDQMRGERFQQTKDYLNLPNYQDSSQLRRIPTGQDGLRVYNPERKAAEEQLLREAVLSAKKENEKKSPSKLRRVWNAAVDAATTGRSAGVWKIAPGAVLTAIGLPQIGVPLMAGATVDQGVKDIYGYENVGDALAQTVGLKPGDKGYGAVSIAGEFLNPGYFMSPSGILRMSGQIANGLKRTAAAGKKAVSAVANKAKSASARSTATLPELPTEISVDMSAIPDSAPRQLHSASNESFDWSAFEEGLPQPETATVQEYPTWEYRRPTHRLPHSDLAPWDVESLMKRGYTEDQIRELVVSGNEPTPRGRGLRRANSLSQDLIATGEWPATTSRQEYLQGALNNGVDVYHLPFEGNYGALNIPGASPNAPVTVQEILAHADRLPADFNMSNLNRATRESIRNYFNLFEPSGSPVRTSSSGSSGARALLEDLARLDEETSVRIPSSSGSASMDDALTDLRHVLSGSSESAPSAIKFSNEDYQKLNRALSVLSKEDAKLAFPEIKRIIESGGGTDEVKAYFENVLSKPYDISRPSIRLNSELHAGGSGGIAIFDTTNELKQAIKTGNIDGGRWDLSNSNISTHPYNIHTVPLTVDTPTRAPGNLSHWYVFPSDVRDSRSFMKMVRDGFNTHGADVFEADMSTGSMPLNLRNSVRSVDNGKGIILYEKPLHGDNYAYTYTNAYGSSVVNPSTFYLGSRPRVHAPTVSDVARDGLNAFNEAKRVMDPRVLAEHGGKYPEFDFLINNYNELTPETLAKLGLTREDLMPSQFVTDDTSLRIPLHNLDWENAASSIERRTLDNWQRYLMEERARKGLNETETLYDIFLRFRYPQFRFRRFEKGGSLKRI